MAEQKRITIEKCQVFRQDLEILMDMRDMSQSNVSMTRFDAIPHLDGHINISN